MRSMATAPACKTGRICLRHARPPRAQLRPRHLADSSISSRAARIVESSAVVAVFPSMKAGKFLAVLTGEPLGYQVTRQSGSHRTLEAEGRPKLLWSYHDGAEVPPGVIRKYLVKQVGLSDDDALALLRG